MKHETKIVSKTSQLDFVQSVHIAKKMGIPFVTTHTVTKISQLAITNKKIPFPWAMKAVGKKLIHKTDAGGIKLNIQNEKEAEKTFSQLKKITGCEYVIVQPMRKGIEIIVGGKMDPQFGPTVLVGMGGIYTEVFKDSSVGILPLEEKDIDRMIQELKIFPILKGTRGEKEINFNDLKKIIRGVAKLMKTEKITEIDLNPVIATPQKVEGVDVRIIR